MEPIPTLEGVDPEITATIERLTSYLKTCVQGTGVFHFTGAEPIAGRWLQSDVYKVSFQIGQCVSSTSLSEMVAVGGGFRTFRIVWREASLWIDAQLVGAPYRRGG